MQITKSSPASTASSIAEAAKGGGTYITETVAPVACFASLTVAKIGIFSKCSPGLFGFTPATKQFLPFAYSIHDFV